MGSVLECWLRHLYQVGRPQQKEEGGGCTSWPEHRSTFLLCGSLFLAEVLLPVSMYGPVQQHLAFLHHYTTHRYQNANGFLLENLRQKEET